MTDGLTILDEGDQDDGEAGLHLHSDAPELPGGASLRRAAVLMPLVREADAWSLLFIRRAARAGDRHSGQVAFPGGASEPGDRSATDTALREAEEEIGLSPDRVTPLAILGDYLTVSHFSVTPLVGVVDWPFPLQLQASEVARVFTIPLAILGDRRRITRRARRDLDPASARRHPIIVYEPWDGETLWGASARMTLNLLKAIDDGEVVLPERPRPA